MASIILAAVMIVSLAACGTSNETSSAASASSAESAKAETTDESRDTSTDNRWSDIMDLSEKETIVMYVIGTKPNDMDSVLELVNERLVSLINTELELNFISYSDVGTKYSLLFTGSDDVDLAYCAGWLNYADLANKNAFLELDDEFISTYLPWVYEHEPESAWKATQLKGKVYGVPRSYQDVQANGTVIVRDDMLEKYGYEDMDTWDDYLDFLYDVTEGESDIYACYPESGMPLFAGFYACFQNFYQVYDSIWYDTDKGNATAENCEYIYTSDVFKEYCMQQAELATAGVWPTDAINNTTSSSDLVIEGKSASIPTGGSNATYIKEGVKDKDFTVSYLNLLSDDNYTMANAMSGDLTVISSYSKNPERAALTLDVLRGDSEINMLLIGGIEGTHYLLNEDGTYSEGDKAENYSWAYWAGSLRNEDLPRQASKYEDYSQVDQELRDAVLPEEVWPFAGFVLDNTEISAEVAVLNSIVTEYETSFNFGAFGDQTEAKYEEFVGKLEDAGLERIWTEWQTQLAAFLAED